MSSTAPATRRPSAAPLRCFWEITRACDHECLHCRSEAGEPAHGELTTDEALEVADQLVALGVRRVVLTGGEPMSRPDWPTLCGRLTAGGVEVGLFSGGRGLDGPGLAAARRVGVAVFAVSLDGPREVHDRLRPRRQGQSAQASSYQDARAALERLVAAGVPTRAVTVVSAVNAPVLFETYALLRELGVRRWQVQLCQNTGRAAEHREQLQPAPQVLEELVQVLLRAAREREIEAPLHCTVGYLTAEEAVLRYRRGTRPSVWSGCHAGLQTMAIGARGEVRGCTALPAEFVTASVRDRSLAEIWNDDRCFPYTRGWRRDVLAGACARCSLSGTCRAGCPAVSFSYTGTTGANPYCLRSVRDGVSNQDQ